MHGNVVDGLSRGRQLTYAIPFTAYPEFTKPYSKEEKYRGGVDREHMIVRHQEAK